MRCRQCQHESPAGVKFCGECGARLDVLCRGCAAANPASNKFCHDCGSPLGEAATGLGSPQTYTPEHLATKILSSRSTLDDERKQVTVMFADLKGSMGSKSAGTRDSRITVHFRSRARRRLARGVRVETPQRAWPARRA